MAMYCKCGHRITPSEPLRIINEQVYGEKCCNPVSPEILDDPPIHDVGLFMKVFKIGDEFYEINSYNDLPTDISGPYHIYSMEYHTSKYANHWAIGLKPDADPIKYIGHCRFIIDIVNEWHGAFKTKEGAEKELAKRKIKLGLN